MARSGDRFGDYHKQFADKLIEQIKQERAPFQKPWKPGERALPENLHTARRYRGGNSLYLGVEAIHRGYTDNRWATYRQIREAGGQVRKGEKGAKVLFFSTRSEQARDDQGNPKLDDKGAPIVERSRPYVRMYTVFNAEQADGLPPRPAASPEPEWEVHNEARGIMEASGVDIRHQAGDDAYYNVRTDQVVLPEAGQFPSTGAYYQTALHELGHATGHPDRMNRDTLDKPFGSPDYAREELRAEIAAMMTGEKIGLGHQPQNGADYIAGWVKALEDDPREIHRAASDAEKISRYLIEPARDRIEEREQETAQERVSDDESAPGHELELAPTPALQVAPSQQQSHFDFNENIQHAAHVALRELDEMDNSARPPDQLIRDLQQVHLTAASHHYTPLTADFRRLREGLQNHTIDAENLDPEQKRTILKLADNFNNQAQSHQHEQFHELSASSSLDRGDHDPRWG